MAIDTKELIALIREDSRRKDEAIGDLLERLIDIQTQLQDQATNFRSQLGAQAEAFRSQLTTHAEAEREKTNQLEDKLRSNHAEVLATLPKLCQANELGAAIRHSTYERKKEFEQSVGNAPASPPPVRREDTGSFSKAPDENAEAVTAMTWIGKKLWTARHWIYASAAAAAYHAVQYLTSRGR